MNSLFIGRFQAIPMHAGHRAIIDKVLKEGKPVIVALRNTEKSKENPFSYEERKEEIKRVYGDKVSIIKVPDIAEVCYGRGVGYKIREISVKPEIEAISGTKLRKGKIWWISGATGSGKTTLSLQFKDVIRLDGDELRKVWKLGFSKKDRYEQNMRTARLARLLQGQGFNVVISTICPYKELRKEIKEMIGCKFVYIEGGKEPTKEYPYEKP